MCETLKYIFILLLSQFAVSFSSHLSCFLIPHYNTLLNSIGALYFDCHEDTRFRWEPTENFFLMRMNHSDIHTYTYMYNDTFKFKMIAAVVKSSMILLAYSTIVKREHSLYEEILSAAAHGIVYVETLYKHNNEPAPKQLSDHNFNSIILCSSTKTKTFFMWKITTLLLVFIVST